MVLKGAVLLAGLLIVALLLRLLSVPVDTVASDEGTRIRAGVGDSKVSEQHLSDMKKKLTPEQYDVCFLGGTETPGTGEYEMHFEPGAYHCVACGNELFQSDRKFDSGSGWPSFWETAGEDRVSLKEDHSDGGVSTEVGCASCGAHLGHVFSDGPAPSGLRY
jgi:peptide-methionine (R)-S-oxide reductase